MTESAASAGINATTRMPRSRVLGLIIGLSAGVGLICLWWWASVDMWSDVDPLPILGGLSVVCVSLLFPFRTRWIGAGLSVVVGAAWLVIGLLVWAAAEWVRRF